jgi:Domain of unknown function (DUF4372)
MVRHASLLSQMITLFSRQKFYELVFRHNSERYCKGFNTWDHFVAMLFCQSAQTKSLREICGGMACCMGKLRHLGMKLMEVEVPKFPSSKAFYQSRRLVETGNPTRRDLHFSMFKYI